MKTLKLIHILLGVGVGVLISAIVINSLPLSITGGFLAFIAIISEYIITNNIYKVFETLLANTFVTLVSTAPFKHGETLVQFLLVSYLVGLLFIALLLISDYGITKGN